MIATMPTLERFTNPIGLTFHRMNVQALVASLRSVCRIDGNQFNPELDAFIAQEQSQLEERPTVRSSTFSLTALLGLMAHPETPRFLAR